MKFSRGRSFRIKLYLLMAFIGLWVYYQKLAPIRFRFPVSGYASWYSRTDPGIKPRTANGEKFNDQAMTCAMWGVPFDTRLKVINRSNGKYVVVRVNDRGPHRRYVHEGRVIDLTKAAFSKISSTKQGLIPVKVEKL